MRTLISRLAAALAVKDVRNPWQWLRRLFLLDATTAKPLPRWIGRVLNTGLDLLTLLPRIALRGVNAVLDAPDYQRLQRRFEAGSERLGRWPPLLQGVAFGLAGLCFWFSISTPLGWWHQLMLFGLLWLGALVVSRVPGSLSSLLLIGFSLVASGRYIWWRFSETLNFSHPLEYVLGYGLIVAEAYTWLIMVLGYAQNARPLGREPVPLPEDRSTWPTVDVFIPTYNEPLLIVKRGVYAALGLDWPREKLRVYLLDDGRRPEFRAFAEAAGAHYLDRPDNAHAKAGNLNHALKQTRGEYVAIFDCDHVPVSSFLTMTLGWCLRDPKCAMVQTPHHFFSADPFERNLGTFRQLPNEGNLFYGLVQDGNDLWNATFFCGSCAVLRRAPLEEVGGIAVETVTEDAHTALKLHRHGYTTAYISQAQAAGLSTTSLASHVGQRIRWARGMTQIFRTDNPFFGPGLSLFQRLCYGNAMLHFFNGLPRLVFLTSPLAFLFFELHVIQAAAGMIAVYALPHIVLSQISNSRMQGRFRHSFWAEVYETVLAWYIALPTTMALINPRLGKFNVTAKDELVENPYFDFQIARPYLVLIALNLLGVLIAVPRLLVWNTDQTSTVVMNLCWALYNLAMLGTAAAVATETRQVRRTHRIPSSMPARLHLANGRVLDGKTTDYSSGGVGVELPQPPLLERGDTVVMEIGSGTQALRLPARVALWSAPRLGLRFEKLTMEQERLWVQRTFGRPDAWEGWKEMADRDRPLSSIGVLLRFSAHGYRNLLRAFFGQTFARPRVGLRRLAANR